MDTDRIATLQNGHNGHSGLHALGGLDAESRALLELSLVRGIPDDELATLLGTDADRVRERREGVLLSLGAETEEELTQLEAALRGESPAHGSQAEEDFEAAAPHPEPEGPEKPAVPPRRARAAVLGGAAIAVIVAGALAFSGGEDDPVDPAAAPAAEPAPGASSGQPEPAAVPLQAVAGGEASGTATVQGRRLTLTVEDLPQAASGGYVVWLYNSISDARPVTGTRRGRFTLRERLPRSAGRYRYLDISREPADGNRNHSGASVLRVPLSALLPG